MADTKRIALNVRQPYAELIVSGKRRVEHRPRSTIKRERIYIFASGALPDAKACAKYGLDPDDCPRGVLIGTVEIVDCEPGPAGYAWRLANPERLETPVRPTSPRAIGSSESSPICVGRSKATESPVWPWLSR